MAGQPGCQFYGFVPQVYSAGGSVAPAWAGEGLSRAAAMGYLDLLLGPVIIGVAAGHAGPCPAMLILPVLAVVIVTASTALGRRVSLQFAGGSVRR